MTTWAHCGRCGRVVVQTRITVAGIDREMRRVLIPSLRESLNAENPLMRWVSGAEPDAG